MPKRRRVWMLALILAGLLWVTRKPLVGVMTGSPYTVQGYLTVALKAYQQAEFGAAVVAFERAVKLDPSRAESHYFLAQALDSVGRTEEAIKEYQASVERNPKLAAPHYNLAILYRTQGKYGAAEAEFKEAIRAFPAFTGAHLMLGTLYYSRNDWENAVSELEAGAKHPFAVSSDKVTFHLMLATAYQKMGRFEDAAGEWRTVLSLDPENREAGEQLRALERR